MPQPLLRKLDCVGLRVPDLDAGLAFYCDKLGLRLIWRTDTSAGLALPDSNAEVVIQTADRELEVDFMVESADQAARDFAAAGGRIVVQPFDIQIGRAAVVADPWGNRYVLLDSTKGLLLTDDQHRVIGNQPLPHGPEERD